MNFLIHYVTYNFNQALLFALPYIIVFKLKKIAWGFALQYRLLSEI